MKILFVSEVYTPTIGGVTSFIRQLARSLVQHGHEVQIFTTSPKWSWRVTASTDDTGAKIYRAPAIPYPPNPKHFQITILPFISASRVILRERPDCIHMHTPAGQSHLVILFWARLLNIPVVLTNHVMPENLVQGDALHKKSGHLLSRLVWRHILFYANRADLVTAPTPTAVAMLRERGLRPPIEAVTNGIDTDFFHPGAPSHKTLQKFGLDAHKGPKLVYIGRLDGEKRIDLIISALPEVLAKLPDARLIIGGRGKCSLLLEEQVKTMGLQNSVIFTGLVTEEEKRDLLRAADAFVIASPSELQCIAGLEALACGAPLVAADVAALKELCQDGKDGYLFPYPDTGALAAAIVRICEDKIKQQQFTAFGRQWVVGHHTHDISAQRYEALYRQCIDA